MTDTANVDLTAVIRWLENGCAAGPAIEELKIYQEQLAAAPKPVSDPFKLDRAAIIEAVKVAMNDAWCDITSDTGCWPADLHRTSERGPVRIEYRPAIWTETTAEMVANALAQPEAPKVEQEGWIKHDGGVRSPVDGSPDLFDFIMSGGGEPYCGQRQPRFWHLVSYWRPHKGNHPAPASDELLETIDMDDFNIIGDWIESGEKGSAPSGRVKGLWQSVRRVIAIAKHKGPQS